MPGTEMKVTPEITAPTMAKATIGQGVRRPEVKNVALSARREASRDMSRSNPK